MQHKNSTLFDLYKTSKTLVNEGQEISVKLPVNGSFRQRYISSVLRGVLSQWTVKGIKEWVVVQGGDVTNVLDSQWCQGADAVSYTHLDVYKRQI